MLFRSEAAFSIDASAITFGAGALGELGIQLRALTEGRRVALFTDRGVAAAGHAERARKSLEAAAFDPVVFDAASNPSYKAAYVHCWLNSGSARASCQPATLCAALAMAACVKAGERSTADGPGSSGESPADARSTDNVVGACPSGAFGWAT